MPFYLIMTLLVAFFSVVFALQNSQLVTVKLFLWRFEGNLALVLLISLSLGFLIGVLAFLPRFFKPAVKPSKLSAAEKSSSKTEEAEHSLTGGTP